MYHSWKYKDNKNLPFYRIKNYGRSFYMKLMRFLKEAFYNQKMFFMRKINFCWFPLL